MTAIQIRIDEKTKRSAKKVLAEVGLDLSTAIRAFLKYIVIHQKLPFHFVAKKRNGSGTHSQVY